MELSAHDVVVVTSEDGNASTTLPVPDSNRLIIRGRQDPRLLVMEVDCSNIVEMAIEGVVASPRLVVPDFDLVIVTSRD